MEKMESECKFSHRDVTRETQVSPDTIGMALAPFTHDKPPEWPYLLSHSVLRAAGTRWQNHGRRFVGRKDVLRWHLLAPSTPALEVLGMHAVYQHLLAFVDLHQSRVCRLQLKEGRLGAYPLESGLGGGKAKK